VVRGPWPAAKVKRERERGGVGGLRTGDGVGWVSEVGDGWERGYREGLRLGGWMDIYWTLSAS
jgi:hypothetical protein